MEEHSAIGVDLQPIGSVLGKLRIDRDGLRLTGTTRASLHPALANQGELRVDLRFAPGNLPASFLHLNGDIAVGGIALGAEASVEISARLFCQRRVCHAAVADRHER